ncbi:DUF4870 domain-containing protein [Rothia sp. P6271]|uniref:DUF4870 domain-containing protein n=1 Tax=unclassified Rothia (in: high G+C Gram-positive bacteria) TaxID=2689056 RepID=UPI003AC00E35
MSDQHPSEPIPPTDATTPMDFYGNYTHQAPHDSENFYDASGVKISDKERSIAVLSHILPIIFLFLSAGTLSIFSPLIIWFIYQDNPDYRFASASAARAFNFNLTLMTINIVAIILTLLTFGLAIFVLFITLVITSLMLLIFHINGALSARQGTIYEYPLQIRVLK